MTGPALALSSVAALVAGSAFVRRGSLDLSGQRTFSGVHVLARAEGSPVRFARLLQAERYDGITFLEGPDHAPKKSKARVWVAFEPTQVKSASGNSGAFDPADPRISANRATP